MDLTITYLTVIAKNCSKSSPLLNRYSKGLLASYFVKNARAKMQFPLNNARIIYSVSLPLLTYHSDNIDYVKNAIMRHGICFIISAFQGRLNIPESSDAMPNQVGQPGTLIFSVTKRGENIPCCEV
jgi:hypothetical protein